MTAIDVCATIERETGQTVTEETLLDKIDVDSLEFIDLLMVLASESGKEITDEQIPTLKTVGDLVRACA